MAEDSGQDKTEEPSSKRLAQARKHGQVARSRELNTVVMLLFSAVLLLMLGARMGNGLLQIMQDNFALSRATIFDPQAMLLNLKQACLQGLSISAPLLAGLCLAACLGPLLLGGWNFSWEAVTPKFEKLDPLKGMLRLFGPSGFIELFKALLKVALVGGVAYLLYRRYLPEFISLNHEPAGAAIGHAFAIIAQAFLVLSAALMLVALFDAPYQLWKHQDALRMTKQEVRDEAKEAEGNPEIKSRIRRLQAERAQGRMMAAIPQADVVVTNPTHFAVALKYDPNAAGAPKVIAKGTDLLATQIRTLAAEADVPLVAAPPLARALYYSTALDHEIPQGLFLAVAQVLAYIFSLKAAQVSGYKPPPQPQDIAIPEAYQHD